MDMKNLQPKPIGTVSLGENNNVSTQNPWEPVTRPTMPYSVLTNPNGFMFAHGSACGSLATTSIEGYKYVSDVHIFRQDGTAVDVDRYIGSVTPENALAVLKIPSGQIPHHHLNLGHPIISNLPPEQKQWVSDILQGK
ncbi:hypothetical protein A2773_01580 [Candidatus Gottesmanbacteria bacterium RIFCSPHIGHO2_01_FULL_39_10]|uniref:Uncharacterized protein n=1 Tax=Candidatus Gottesmanbacteria bacterium RIFCSPHIGHO2_01_FULL_39_10 TaxID=1798375 RepID=A0A1F5ZN75_9BACT|nr:MAG: hypothetical protein A2773_01580 [Candidatus Gottesmanbacteria bacterium RIFCSPHIGHO2_01_FULL_39_10]